MKWGGGELVGFRGGRHEKKWLFRGAITKYKGKRGGQEKYFGKTLKWHNVFILKKIAVD